MTKPELIEKLYALAQEAKVTDGLEPAAAVILSLCGALHAGSDVALMHVCADFSVRDIERLTGEPD